MQNKRDIILLHGAIGCSKQLDVLDSFLSEKFVIHRFDFPGHGSKANQASNFSIYNFVNFLRNYILDSNLIKPFVFGYSMGGYVALTLESFENTFDKIMTLNTKFDWSKETAEKEKKMFIPELIEKKVPHFAENLIAMHGDENWKRLLSYHRNLMDDIADENVLNSNLLKKIDKEVLICRSEKDEMVTKSESINVTGKIKGAEYYEIENSRHAIEQIDIEILVNKMNQFFS